MLATPSELWAVYESWNKIRGVLSFRNNNTDNCLLWCKASKDSFLTFYIQKPEIDVPVLVFQQFIVDLLNVNLLPQNVVVAIDIIDDRVVQVVQFLKQVQFFFDSL